MSRSNILHLDPSEANRSLVAACHLRMAPSSSLVQVTDPDSARRLIDADTTFDLVLVAIDLDKPKSGLDFIRRLREEHTYGPPIYTLHSTLDPCVIRDVILAGAEGVLPTSDPGAFSEALHELFGLHLPAIGIPYAA